MDKPLTGPKARSSGTGPAPVFPRFRPKVTSYPVPAADERATLPPTFQEPATPEPVAEPDIGSAQGRLLPNVPPHVSPGTGPGPWRWRRRLLVVVAAPLVLVQAIAFLFQMGLTPPRTAYMLEAGEPNIYQFVSINHISRHVLAATIAHEDEQLGTRKGAFDLADFQARALAYLHGQPDPSGSTIPQQLVKNIFLWDDQSAARKGIEAIVASQFSSTLSAPRTLELYLNYAQFGPHLYGICAASWYYFGTPPWAMTDYQSAQLMGVLPLPGLVKRDPNGGIYLGAGVDRAVWNLVNGAANVWVPRQIANLGGWQNTVATVGITDTADSYADQRKDTDACSTMPRSVQERISSETD